MNDLHYFTKGTSVLSQHYGGRETTIQFHPNTTYENFYCARGDMENRIKEQQMDLFADRTSTHWMASNQLRLWFSAFAHLIMSTLQAEILTGTELAVASIGQIRLRLFKIAARFTVSVRRIHIELCFRTCGASADHQTENSRFNINRFFDFISHEVRRSFPAVSFSYVGQGRERVLMRLGSESPRGHTSQPP